MIRLFSGMKTFSESVYPKKEHLFTKLAEGQSPHTLFITCSDSRIDPNLITQTDPGEIFVIRNAGNLVPSYKGSGGAEEAAIEFALEGLGVENIVVCGHAYCGAMEALQGKADLTKFPAVKEWLKNAHKTKKRMEEKNLTDPIGCIGENVLVQIENLKTHPTVVKRLDEGKLNLFAWVYNFEKGDASYYHKEYAKFISSREFRNIGEREIEKFSL